MISELGRLSEKIKNLTERIAFLEIANKRALIATNIIIPVATIPMVFTGAILMVSNNDYGKPVFYTGLGLLIGCELVWNGGHLIFKIW